MSRGSGEAEIEEMARAEFEELRVAMAELEEEAKRALLPKDPNDDRNVLIEIRAGAGGDEAGLWAGDLLRAYTRYAEGRHWTPDIVSANAKPGGGVKEVILQVTGEGAFSRFKYESGVHRVQRVPETEAQGRIHTSTATVAVLPEAEAVDVEIAESDVRMDRFHSGGAGGQNVNKVETGVRLTHEPTGIVVTCTDERSQLKNRLKAMSVLRARLYDMQMREAVQERSDRRRSQVGHGRSVGEDPHLQLPREPGDGSSHRADEAQPALGYGGRHRRADRRGGDGGGGEGAGVGVARAGRGGGGPMIYDADYQHPVGWA